MSAASVPRRGRRLAGPVLALAIPAGLLAGVGAGGVVAVAVPVLVACILGLIGEVPLFLVILTAVSGVGFYWVEGGVTVAGQAINLSGLHWGLVVATAGVLVLRRPPRRLPPPVALYGIFLAIAALALLWTSAPFEGLKQLLLYLLPALVAGVVLTRVHRVGEIRLIEGGYWLAFGVALTAAAGFTLMAWARGEWLGLVGGMGNRTLAIFALPMMALALGSVRHRSPAYLWAVAAVFLVGVATLSRTAVLILVILPLLATTGMRRAPRLLVLGLSLLVALGAMRVEAFRERFGQGRISLTEVTVEGKGTDAALSVGGLNLSGRGWLWLQVWQHATERPILGHGTGSATVFTRDLPRSPAAHPHNEYLRVLHDQGLVGLVAILAFGFGSALHFRRLHRRATTSRTRQLALAAYLATAAYGMIAVTDNPLVYASFFTQNVFILFALAEVSRRLDDEVTDPGPGAERSAPDSRTALAGPGTSS